MKVKKLKSTNKNAYEIGVAPLVKVKSKKDARKIIKNSKPTTVSQTDDISKLQNEISAILSGSFGEKLTKCAEDITNLENVTKKKKKKQSTDVVMTEDVNKLEESSKKAIHKKQVASPKGIGNKHLNEKLQVNTENKELKTKILKDKSNEQARNITNKKIKKRKLESNVAKEIVNGNIEGHKSSESVIIKTKRSKKTKLQVNNAKATVHNNTDKDNVEQDAFKKGKHSTINKINEKPNKKQDYEKCTAKKMKVENSNNFIKAESKKFEDTVEANDMTNASIFPYMDKKKTKKKSNLIHSNIDSNIDFKRNNVADKTPDLAKILQDEKKVKLYNILNVGGDVKVKPAKLAGKRKLTKLPLRERMMEKLKAARFRYLNEQIYTTEGSEAKTMFQQDPDAFKAYHEGFSQQVNRWPINPVDVIIESIKKMPKSLVIADFGCGDAKLAKVVENTVHSFDLIASDETITACDMANVPLPNSSVDIAVFCLSLMGTNLQDYIKEANRVLKIGGTLKIAEVESRFDKVEDFIKGISCFGFKKTWNNLANDIFFFIDFKKTTDVKGKNSLTLSLKPCLYKKR